MLAAMAMSVIACNKEQIESAPSTELEGQLMTFTATAPNGNVDAPQAKSEIHIEGQTTYSWWSPGDVINVFADQSTSVEYKSNITVSSKTAEFTSQSGEQGNDYIAVYGSIAKDLTVKDQIKNANRQGNIIHDVILPNQQTAVAGSYDPKAVLAAAYTTNAEKNLIFHNAVALLKFQIADSDIYNVTISGKDEAGKQANICGRGCINNCYDKPSYTSYGEDNNGTYIELKNSNNKLEQNTTYYIAVAPGTYSELTVELNKVRVKFYGHKGPNNITLGAGQLFDLGVLSMADGDKNITYDFSWSGDNVDDMTNLFAFYKDGITDVKIFGDDWMGGSLNGKKIISLSIPLKVVKATLLFTNKDKNAGAEPKVTWQTIDIPVTLTPGKKVEIIFENKSGWTKLNAWQTNK